MYQLLEYEFQPGLAARAPSQLPKIEGMQPDPALPTLIVVIHPRCPCSRASLEELDSLLSHHPNRTNAYCVFVWPASQKLEWVHSDNYKQAQRIAGLKSIVDFEGRRAAQLGALTSGQTYLYARDGHLLFSGGLTGSRGHAGDNSSLAQLGELLNQTNTSKRPAIHADVYGCAAAPAGKELTHGRSCCEKK